MLGPVSRPESRVSDLPSLGLQERLHELSLPQKTTTPGSTAASPMPLNRESVP